MRNVLIGFATLVVLAVAVVLIVPGYIDWNEYKQDITRQVQTLRKDCLSLSLNNSGCPKR